MSESVQQEPTRRGRRPRGADTRAALLAAAREVFTEQGYDGATVRAIAGRAGVDAAMVNHWFGGKDKLFSEAVLQVPFNPNEIIAELMKGDIHDLGERIIRRFLTSWDEQGGGVFAALIRSVAAHEQVAHALRDFFTKHVFGQLAGTVAQDQPALRANLVASQLIGLGVTRYVAEFDPLATADVETLVAAIGPNVQRYLTGSLSS
ncbi:Transcriptional regulator, TetR family [Alloactinosynnema sp. L-07]|uniref:TetR/AcrR family transcriptional regulator n=1 Tax=Alloactinosynnema sp. L-07 TaxID=1653480 RepID=UPI00065EF1EF|nr:TetR family transcriptional regulator [Alloactinosynnema sp. L-07]CRK58803.1 Transcriptional regulator, TetR family [Alloactinosynnema sp. L-07]